MAGGISLKRGAAEADLQARRVAVQASLFELPALFR
jgi:hypothetical protein